MSNEKDLKDLAPKNQVVEPGMPIEQLQPAMQVVDKPEAMPDESEIAAMAAQELTTEEAATTAKEPGMPIEKPAAHISEAEMQSGKEDK